MPARVLIKGLKPNIPNDASVHFVISTINTVVISTVINTSMLYDCAESKIVIDNKSPAQSSVEDHTRISTYNITFQAIPTLIYERVYVPYELGILADKCDVIRYEIGSWVVVHI